MSSFKNVSGDTVDLPHLDARVGVGEVLETDLDLSGSPLFKKSTRKTADVVAYLPVDEPVAVEINADEAETADEAENEGTD